MFNFKNLSGLAQVMMKTGSLPHRIREIRESLSRETATGTAAEGSIQVEVSGTGEVRKLSICTSLIRTGTTEQLERLLPQAINEALGKVRQMHLAKIRELTGGLEIPGLEEALGDS